MMSFLNANTLPVIFAGLMALSILLYVILDGFDLGTGMLLPFVDDRAEADVMVASIGPYWDANETWLVLGVGLLLIAFPKPYGIILGELYLPVAFMLIGLIIRGCAFDFRVKARDRHQKTWNTLFIIGSYLASFSQGIMIGRYITGFTPGIGAWIFAAIVGIGVCFGYILLGSTWLLIKTEGHLQTKVISWIKNSIFAAAAAVLMVSIATPLVSTTVVNKWFSFPNIILLAPLPVACLVLFGMILKFLHQFSSQNHDKGSWVPFACTVGIVLAAFVGLAYSIFPDIILDQMNIWETAQDPETLLIVLWGALLVLPAIIGYTIFVHYIFRGKATDIHYD